MFHSTCRTHNPIPAVALVELGTFCRAVFRSVAIEHNHGVANLLHAVGTHFTYRQDRIELTTRVGPSVHQIALAVVIPKRRGVNHALAFDNALRLRPFAFRVFGGSHKHTQVRIAPIDIIGLIILIIADAWCPNAVSMLGDIVTLQRRQCLDGIVHNLPVHQILRGIAHHTHQGVAGALALVLAKPIVGVAILHDTTAMGVDMPAVGIGP